MNGIYTKTNDQVVGRFLKDFQPVKDWVSKIKIRGVGIYLIFLLFQSYGFAQCPAKSDFHVTVTEGPDVRLEIEVDSININNFSFELLEVQHGAVDISNDGIIETNETNRKIFSSLPAGEYLIKVTDTDCKLYLDSDNRGTGFIIKE